VYPCQLDLCFKVYTANRRAALPPNPQRQLLSSAAALRKTRINATPGSPLCAADPRLRGLISSGSADCRLSSKPRVFLFFRDLRPEQKSYILCRSHPYPRGKEENVVKGRKVLSHLIHRSGVRLTILYVPPSVQGTQRVCRMLFVCSDCCACGSPVFFVFFWVNYGTDGRPPRTTPLASVVGTNILIRINES
jgi:hypothetical protein